MNIKEFLIFLTSIIISLSGQIFLKLGALKLGKATGQNFLSHIFTIVLTPELLIGLTCYGLGAILYILLLTRINLSVLAPSASMMYIFSVLAGYFIFQEPIPLTRAIGLGFIVCGVFLILWQK
jgi:drug/metabolite transporter (DMT)-like permease